MDLVTNNYYDNLSTLSPNGSVAPLGCCSAIGCGSGGYPVVNTSRRTTKNMCLGGYSVSSNLSGGLYNIKFTDTKGESWPLGSCQKTVSGVPHYPASVPGWNVYSDSACGEDIGVCYVTCTPNGVCNTPGTVLSQAVSSSVCDGLVSIFQSNNPECNCVKGGGGQFQVAPEVIPPVPGKVFVPGDQSTIIDRRITPDSPTYINDGDCYKITIRYRIQDHNGVFVIRSHTGRVKVSKGRGDTPTLTVTQAFQWMRPDIPDGALEVIGEGNMNVPLGPPVRCSERNINPSISDPPYDTLRDVKTNILDSDYIKDRIVQSNYDNTLGDFNKQMLEYQAQIKKIQDDEIEWRRRYMEEIDKIAKRKHINNRLVPYGTHFYWTDYYYPQFGTYYYSDLNKGLIKNLEKIKKLEEEIRRIEERIRNKEYANFPEDLLPPDVRGLARELLDLIAFHEMYNVYPWEYTIDRDGKKVKITNPVEMQKALDEWNEKIKKENERIQDIKDKRAELKSYNNHGNRAQFAGPNAPIIRDTI